MNGTKAALLIVDDEPSIRESLSQFLAEEGYGVRSASDSLSALVEIRREVPEVLISDLNMPGMSGIELLSVVRRRFPQIKVIAMSGAFSGKEAPSGVVADAFYQKGASFGPLLRVMDSLAPEERMVPKPAAPSAPIWISSNGQNARGEDFATIECPECLRTFPEVLDGAIGPIGKTECVYCGSPVRYAIVPPVVRASSSPLRQNRPVETAATRPRRNSVYEAHVLRADRERHANA
jgi:CheY-like chemotaxis protein